MQGKQILMGGIKSAGRMLLAGIMCLIVSISLTAMLDNQFLRVVTQLISLVIFISMSYVPVWNEGNGDVNKINYERMTRDDFRGLKYGLIAAIPGFILYALFLMARFGVINQSFFGIYRFLTPIFLPLNMSLMPSTLTMQETPVITALLVGFETLLPILVCGFAYALGLRRYSLSERFIYPIAPQRKKKKPRLRRY